MNSRLAILLPLVTLAVGFALGVLGATSLFAKPDAPPLQVLQLTDDDQTDYIANVADAYANDGNLNLAQDRLARLQDPHIVTRVETLALEMASQRNQTSQNLARLAVALGSQVSGLVALFMTPTSTDVLSTRLNTPTSKAAPVFSNVRATQTPVPSATRKPVASQPPQYVVVPNANPYIVLPTNTPTITPTRRPATRVPTATITPTPTPVPPPPYPFFEPDLSQWWGTIHFEPANVQPGQGYWHLEHAIYCDAFDGSDPRRHDFGCDEMPGGSTGTNIYVMSGGNPIDVWSGDRNVGDDSTVIGDKKNPGDMCDCDYSFESSDYRISVRGAPSDSISGFCLCGKNFGWGSHAHVRYFLYFKYIIR